MMIVVLYAISFFLEKKPCTICSLVFFVAVVMFCYSGTGGCILDTRSCAETEECQFVER